MLETEVRCRLHSEEEDDTEEDDDVAEHIHTLQCWPDDSVAASESGSSWLQF